MGLITKHDFIFVPDGGASPQIALQSGYITCPWTWKGSTPCEIFRCEGVDSNTAKVQPRHCDRHVSIFGAVGIAVIAATAFDQASAPRRDCRSAAPLSRESVILRCERSEPRRIREGVRPPPFEVRFAATSG